MWLKNKDVLQYYLCIQACRTPVRTEDGIELLFKYYNHLYFVERRFFAPEVNLGIYFEWLVCKLALLVVINPSIIYQPTGMEV